MKIKVITKFILSIIVLLFCFFISFDAYGQGVIKRPAKVQTQTRKAKGKSTRIVAVSNPDGYINGHGYVDLGLPSGTKWATNNIGANTDNMYGELFVWAEVNPMSPEKGHYSIAHGKKIMQLKSEGIINDAGDLFPSYDVAFYQWGSQWRMPTKFQFDELIRSCRWIWTTVDNVKGYRITGPNGKSIFLPAAGDSLASPENRKDSYGEYWSSSVYEIDDSYQGTAYYLVFDKDERKIQKFRRDNARSVRAVVF